MKDKLFYQQYEPPEITVCWLDVELGFAGSDTEGDGTISAPDWEIIH